MHNHCAQVQMFRILYHGHIYDIFITIYPIDNLVRPCHRNLSDVLEVNSG